MCGYPCSGKSKCAEELRHYFTQHTDRKVHVIDDDILGIEKNLVYAGECRDGICSANCLASVVVSVRQILNLKCNNNIDSCNLSMHCASSHSNQPVLLNLFSVPDR